MSCESWDTNEEYDILSKPIQGCLLDPISCYLGENKEKYLTHPYASPLFGDFSGLPPMLIQAGDAEVLRDEAVLLAHKASLAGVKVKHELYEDGVSLRSCFSTQCRTFSQCFFFCRCLFYSKQVHAFQTYPFLDVSRKAHLSCREFIKEQFPEWQTSFPETPEGQEDIDDVYSDGIDSAEGGWAGGETSQDGGAIVSRAGSRRSFSRSCFILLYLLFIPVVVLLTRHLYLSLVSP